MKLCIVIFYLSVVFSVLSCGVKEDVEAFDNVLNGTWSLTNLKCYNTDLTGTLIENYSIDTEEITYTFNGVTFSYAAESSGVCTNGGSGSYAINYSAQGEGTITFSNVLTDGVCDISIAEDNGAGSISVPFALTATISKITDLEWYVSSDTLVLGAATGFTGSSGGSYCNSNCTCYGTYSKN